MKSRIDLVTGYGIMGLEIRKCLDCFDLNNYKMTLGSYICFLGNQVIGNNKDNLPKTRQEIERFIKDKTLVSIPLYLYKDEYDNRLCVTTFLNYPSNSVSDGILGYLYLTNEDLGDIDDDDFQDIIEFFEDTSSIVVTELGCMFNREVYEYQNFFNFKEVGEKSEPIFGKHPHVMRKINKDYLSQRSSDKSFLGKDKQYIIDNIKINRNVAEIWEFSEAESKTIAQYILLCLEEKEKQLKLCCKYSDKKGIEDAKLSIGNMCVRTKIHQKLMSELENEVKNYER